MSDTVPMFFDYLMEYGDDLEAALGVSELSSDIDYWRHTGMEHPDAALVGCRKIIESALKKLCAPLPAERIRLQELIDYAFDEGVISKSIALKCHEIRNKGNLGAHGDTVKAIDAKMTLELLDDFLRWCAVELGIVSSSYASATPIDPVFIVRSDDELSEMARLAKLAASLGEDKDIEKKARKAKDKAVQFADRGRSDLDKMADLLRQAQAIGASAGATPDSKATATHQKLIAQCERNVAALVSSKSEVSNDVDAIDAEIEEILSEHDFIRKLLRGDSRATEKQLGVMAFPRGSNSVTNVLQIAGGAGTGKTLCLLAKIISEIDDKGQANLFANQRKTALFICFNKGLANYVRSILAGYEGNLPYIEVAHYDEFINQLVRKKPKAGFGHLAQYANDVRYGNSRIIYGNDDVFISLLKQAQQLVATRYPQRATDYYLDSSNSDELNWLKDELNWIEVRFADKNDAYSRYPSAERIGRGSQHRPSEEIRRVILEIWVEFNRLLEAEERYTIEQATKRLLRSDNLPSYDAIAIDEVQDFSLLSIQLLLRFRRNSHSRIYLSGDENQKIYRRDFTWKELDEDLKGYTITLQKNMRNSAAIRRFSDRLLGKDCPKDQASRFIYVVNADDNRTIELLRKLTAPGRNETTVLISNRRGWISALRSAGVTAIMTAPGDISKPGLYLIGDLMGKGLEFDNVVVDYTYAYSEDDEEEKRLRYVHFTRARKRLYIRYQGEPPRLLSDYYADYLS